MIAHTQVLEKGRIVVRYTREHWREFFMVEVGHGHAYPRFFLPTHRSYMRGTTYTWIFPLAPFVLLFVILRGALWNIWRDLMEYVELLNK